MNYKKDCDITISKAANGFIIYLPTPAAMKTVVNGSASIGGIELVPPRPYVFENMKNMNIWIKAHFK